MEQQKLNHLEHRVKCRFLVFGGDVYYASGGFHDYMGSFDTLEEAERFANATHQVHPKIDRQEDNYEWWHIFDMAERRIVKHSEFQGYGAPNGPPRLDE